MKKTHSVYIEDKKRGHENELFFASIAEAAIRIDELHTWARDNGYKIGADYSITLKAI